MKPQTRDDLYSILYGAIIGLVAFIFIAYSHGAWAGTAFYKGERETGMTKICYYEYLGNEYAITIKVIELCPLTIEV